MTVATRRTAVSTAAVLALCAALSPLDVAAHSVPLSKPAPRHEAYPVPPSGTYSFAGRGFGHGHGMSQWGAYGAAKVDHLSANQILHFYYPHTQLATRSTKRVIQVLLTAADAPGRGYVEVKPADGLSVTPVGGGDALQLRTKTKKGHLIKAWRLQRDGSDVDLQERFGGTWHTVQQVANGATFTDADQLIQMFLPGRKVRFRGGITGEIENGSMEAVNVVNLESYLQGVVPSEMSSSWSPAALQAQAVAARTYATRGTAHPKSSWFDVFGDTRDQAYGGYAAEAPRSNAAVQRTAGEVIVDHSNHAVLAQYSSADGGWTVSGGVKYLPAQHDPYDGLVANDSHKWTSSVSAASISSAYPSIGTLQQIIITGRDGNGLWGGRVTALTLQGSKASVNLTGSDFQFGFGLRSPWFRPPPPPGPPTSLDAKATGKTATATWKAPTEIPGGAKVTGYEFRLGPGRHRQTMSAGTLTASVSGLKAGSYTVHVIAQSNAGSGPAAVATVVVKAAHQ